MNQQLRLIDSLLGLLDDTSLTEPAAIEDSLLLVNHIFCQLGNVSRLETLDDVQDLCRLYGWWHFVSTKHLTFAKNSPREIDGVTRIYYIREAYSQYTDVIREVKEGLAKHEKSEKALLTTLNKTLFEMTH